MITIIRTPNSPHGKWQHVVRRKHRHAPIPTHTTLSGYHQSLVAAVWHALRDQFDRHIAR